MFINTFTLYIEYDIGYYRVLYMETLVTVKNVVTGIQRPRYNIIKSFFFHCSFDKNLKVKLTACFLKIMSTTLVTHTTYKNIKK